MSTVVYNNGLAIAKVSDDNRVKFETGVSTLVKKIVRLAVVKANSEITLNDYLDDADELVRELGYDPYLIKESFFFVAA